jgi:hypothetical protein
VSRAGGPIIVVECGLRWPTTRRGDRHVWIAALASRAADHSRETNQARAWPPPKERPPRVELESRAASCRLIPGAEEADLAVLPAISFQNAPKT